MILYGGQLAFKSGVKMRRSGLASRRVAKFAMACAAVFFLLASRNSAARPQVNSSDPGVERGREQFKESCGFCHGPDATGARGPDLVRSPLVAHDVKGDKLGEVIHVGRPDKGMPPLPLTDQQVQDIAAYLHARAAEALNSGEVPSKYPLEKLLTGDAVAGRAYFNGAGGCKGCHSPTGDLAGIAAKYSPIDLQARMLYPGGKHTTAVVTLPSGEQIKGPVAHADDFVIALRDASGWYRSFSRERVQVELQDPLAAHRELLDKLTQADFHNLFAYVESLK
jgi:cytochrome c oxidase cbb3-type subunit 3